MYKSIVSIVAISMFMFTSSVVMAEECKKINRLAIRVAIMKLLKTVESELQALTPEEKQVIKKKYADADAFAREELMTRYIDAIASVDKELAEVITANFDLIETDQTVEFGRRLEEAGFCPVQ